MCDCQTFQALILKNLYKHKMLCDSTTLLEHTLLCDSNTLLEHTLLCDSNTLLEHTPIIVTVGSVIQYRDNMLTMRRRPVNYLVHWIRSTTLARRPTS